MAWGRMREAAGKSEIDNTKQKRATTRMREGRGGEAAALVMTVDKQQQCDGARHMSRDEREPRGKSEEQGGEISHFFVGSPAGKASGCLEAPPGLFYVLIV